MCDLWQHTTERDTPRGAIPAQVASRAHGHCDELEPARSAQIKLYNAGSFFDPRAVPDDDYDAIAARLAGFSRVIVESHPALVGDRTWRLLDALRRHQARCRPDARSRDGARDRASRGARAPEQADDARTSSLLAARRSQSPASRCACSCSSLRRSCPPTNRTSGCCARSTRRSTPARRWCRSFRRDRETARSTRSAEDGLFRRPSSARRSSASLALAMRARARTARPRVFADLWDLERFADCPLCLTARRARLRAMNLEQRRQPPVSCPLRHRIILNSQCPPSADDQQSG